MTHSSHHGSDRVGHGESSLGDAQSENPPEDPEYIEDDQDAEPPREGEAAEHPYQPDQAEGE